MNVLDTPLDNYNVFLRSSQYTQALNNQKSNLVFELNHPILTHPNMDLLVSLESFNFTNSFYTVNAYNSKFYFSFSQTGIPYTTVTIGQGNYDIDSLIQTINSNGVMQQNNMIAQYNSQFMKITMSSAQQFQLVNPFNHNLNMYELMGFDDFGSTEFSYNIRAPHVANLQSVQTLHVVAPNLNTASIGVKNTTRYSILGSIHVNSLPGELQTWSNTSGFKYKIQDTAITFINMIIYDQDFNIIDFNGIDWYANITFQPIYRPELRVPKYLEDMDTENMQYERYLREEEDRNLIREFTDLLARKKSRYNL